MESNILTVTINPALDKIISIDALKVGQLNRVHSIRLDPGGKGINVAKALSTYGTNLIATGILGGCNGKEILSMLKGYKFNKDFIKTHGETRVNIKVHDLKMGNITELNEMGTPIGSAEMEAFYKKLKRLLKKCRIMVLAGSLPPGVTAQFYTTCIEMAANMDTRVIFDADGVSLKTGIQSKPFAIKPNIHELEMLCGKTFQSHTEIKEEVEAIAKKGIGIILVSLGEKGSIFHYKDMTYYVSPLQVDVKSTVGCGDAMVAGLAYSIRMDLQPDEIARITMAAGCLTAAKEGSEMAEWAEIKKVYTSVTIEEI